MKHQIFCAAVIFLAGLLISCVSAPTKAEEFAAFYEEEPVSILIMPPINNSIEAGAKESFYTTLAVPLAEQGYYVFPPFISMEILQKESAYDAELFYEKSIEPFRDYFGADMVLFTKIINWEKSLLLKQVTVNIEYTVISAKTNNIIYKKQSIVTQNTDSGIVASNFLGLIAKLAVDAINTAVTDYFDLARNANKHVMEYLPKGKYHPLYKQDGEDYSGSYILSSDY